MLMYYILLNIILYCFSYQSESERFLNYFEAINSNCIVKLVYSIGRGTHTVSEDRNDMKMATQVVHR